MINESVTTLFYESIRIVLMLLLPLLLPILFSGLFVSLLQTITQINEQTLSFIPKIISVLLVSIFFGPWMLRVILDYMKGLFQNIPYFIFYIC